MRIRLFVSTFGPFAWYIVVIGGIAAYGSRTWSSPLESRLEFSPVLRDAAIAIVENPSPRFRNAAVSLWRDGHVVRTEIRTIGPYGSAVVWQDENAWRIQVDTREVSGPLNTTDMLFWATGVMLSPIP